MKYISTVDKYYYMILRTAGGASIYFQMLIFSTIELGSPTSAKSIRRQLWEKEPETLVFRFDSEYRCFLLSSQFAFLNIKK
jgi:hypothetical protein